MSSHRKFQRFNLATITAVYLLILVGAIVRSQGAGMGCPDWPQCFGNYVPPTSVEELPVDYKAQMVEKRLSKNARLSEVLQALGLGKLATQVRNDPNVQKEHAFDPTKAWIEYINRLVGVAIGIFVFINMVYSFRYRKSNLLITALGVGIFILTAFQGWVGSLVVSTNLLPGFITFHMLLALLMVGLLIWMYLLIGPAQSHTRNKSLKILLGFLFVLLLPQIISGTLTREQVDVILDSGISRSGVVSNLMGSYYIHRSYSWILLGLAIVSYIKLKKLGYSSWSLILLGLVIVEVLVGVGLAYLGMPVFLAPLHLLAGSLLFGVVFYLFLREKMAVA